MAIKYLDAKRLQGTNAERLALTASVTNISDTSLKAYWKFINSATPLPNASESSATLGTNADAIISGMTFGTTSPFDTEGIFDGNDKLTIGTSLSQFNFMHNTSALWTVCFWFKDDQVNNDQGIFNTSDSAWVHQNVGMNIVTLSSSVGKFRINVNKGGSQGDVAYLITSEDFIPDTDWHFYCITYDQSLASNNLKITVDDGGLEQATKSGATPSSSDSAQIALVGVHTGSSGYLDGSLTEMSVWNRILTSGEITTLYNSGDGTAIYTPTALNLPNGTIFNEVDTYKYFMWNSSAETWHQMVSS